MRCKDIPSRAALLVALVGLTLPFAGAPVGLADPATPAASPAATPGACPATTEAQHEAIARVWHDEVINKRNPTALNDILAPTVVHHAAGGYPQLLDEGGVTAMMGDFLAAFPDLHYDFDFFIDKDDYVVERYTATGTQTGPLGDLAPTGRTATWTGNNIFRFECGKIAEVWSEVDAVSRTQQLLGTPVANPGG
ncbi:MAG TPA: ester cyclase [Thermomicrobiales bacterium]|nr:ester cyclase [Thermomicrobiales bacterium]